MPFIVKKIVRIANSYLHETCLSVQTKEAGYFHQGGSYYDKENKKRWRYKAKG